MDLAEVRRNLETVEAGLDDTACIDLIRGLEDLKNAAAAAQARASLASILRAAPSGPLAVS